MNGVANLLTVNRYLGLNVVWGLREIDFVGCLQDNFSLYEARVQQVATVFLISVVDRSWPGGARAKSYGDVLRLEWQANDNARPRTVQEYTVQTIHNELFFSATVSSVENISRQCDQWNRGWEHHKEWFSIGIGNRWCPMLLYLHLNC